MCNPLLVVIGEFGRRVEDDKLTGFWSADLLFLPPFPLPFNEAEYDMSREEPALLGLSRI